MGRKLLYQEIYDSLLSDIRNGTLIEGARLPSENEISKKYGVSRITSKKALDMLTEKGMISRKPGLGSFVRASAAENFAETPEQPGGEGMLIGMTLNGISEVHGNTLLHKAYEYALQKGYRLITMFTLESQENEEQAIRTLKDLGAKGIMIKAATGSNYSMEIIKNVIDGFPIVCLHMAMRGFQACVVSVDHQAVMMEVIGYLVGKGHNRIGYYSSPPTASMGLMETYDCFIEAMCRHNISDFYQYICTNQERTPNFIFYGEKENIDKRNIQEYLQNNPELTAVVTLDYRAAIVFREVLEDMGKKCPDDLSIISFFEQTRPSTPKFFHHIYIDEAEMAREGIDLLIQSINAPNPATARINVGYQLVEGRSVRDISGGK